MTRREQLIANTQNQIIEIEKMIDKNKQTLLLTIYQNFYDNIVLFTEDGKDSTLPINIRFDEDQQIIIPATLRFISGDEPPELRGKGRQDGVWQQVDGWILQVSSDNNYCSYTRSTRIDIINSTLEEDSAHNSDGTLSNYSVELEGVNTEVRSKYNERKDAAVQYADDKNNSELSYSDKAKREYYTDATSYANQGSHSADLAKATNDLYNFYDQLYYYNNQLALLQDPSHEVPEITEVTPKEHKEVEAQEGHIFPVEMVGNVTNKLIDYNNQLANYVNEVDQYEQKLRKAKEKGIGKINLDFIAKKVEQFCKRINYWLAWLRYHLVKGLRGVYKSIEDVINPWITTLINVVSALTSINLLKIVSAVIDFAKAFLAIILGPYKQYVQFGVDVAKYVPPLVQEATDFVDTTQVAVNKGTALYNELKQEVQNIANTAKNTDLLDPEVSKRLLEKYTNISEGNYNFNIGMESISLSDIISGDDPEKPKWDDFK